MATNKSIRALSRAGFRAFVTGGAISEINVANGTTIVDIDDRKTQLVLAAEKDNYVRTKDAGTVTISDASPAVCTFSGHGFINGDIVQFTTTGGLPAGLTVGTNYYVINSTTNTFKVAATYGGTAINTSSAGSGTHTVTPVSTSLIGLTRYGFRIKTTDGNQTWVKLGSGVATVDTSDMNTARILRRITGEYIYTTSATSLSIRGISDEQLGFHVFVPADSTGTITTSNSGDATNAKTVTVGGQTYTFKTTLTEVRASGTITTSGTGAANLDTVTIGGTTYTFKTSITTANDILRDGTEDHDLTNLIDALTNGVGGANEGVKYGTGTAARTDVSLSAVVSHATTVTAAVGSGTTGNSIVLSKTGSVLTVSGSGTLSSGVNPVANEVHLSGVADTTLGNLADAINGTGGTAGTDWASNTVANTSASASTVTSHAITLTSIAPGNPADSIALSTNEPTYTVVGFSGGEDGATNVRRSTTISGIDPRTPGNYQALRRQYKHYISL